MRWPTHLRDVGDRLHLHLRGAHDLSGGGVQDLHSNRHQEAGPEGNTLSQAFIEVLVLVHEGVLTGGAVHVDPGWAHSRQEA